MTTKAERDLAREYIQRLHARLIRERINEGHGTSMALKLANEDLREIISRDDWRDYGCNTYLTGSKSQP